MDFSERLSFSPATAVHPRNGLWGKDGRRRKKAGREVDGGEEREEQQPVKHWAWGQDGEAISSEGSRSVAVL